MKIKYKLLISFIIVIVILIAMISFFNQDQLCKNVVWEKTELYMALSRQVLVSFDFLSDDIEYYLFDNIINAKIPETLLADQDLGIKQVHLESQLRVICANTSYINSILIVDNNNNLFYGSHNRNEDELPECLSSLVEQGFFDVNNETAWLRDEGGTVYLKRIVRKIFPQQDVGIMVAVINDEYLKSVIGMDNNLDGTMCIFKRSNEMLLSGGEIQRDRTVIFHAIETLNSGAELGGAFFDNGKEYRIISQLTKRGDWRIINMVPMEVLLRTANQFNKTSLIIGLAIGLFAVVLSFVLSNSLTKNIAGLADSMERVSNGELDISIPVVSRDEIGRLAMSFNWMLRRIKEITQQMVNDATYKHEVKYELLEFKYRSLQAQVSPHFICNILSAINALSDLGETEKMGNLSVLASRYLRKNLKDNDRKFTSVRDEIHVVREYIRLYRTIFALRFTYVSKIEPAVRDKRIPHMILQPLVENALVHGLKNIRVKKYRIFVDIHSEEDRLIITVSDNGCGFDPRVVDELKSLNEDIRVHRKYSGFGTGGVISRLKLLYEDRYTFDIFSAPEEGSKIIIRLPLEDLIRRHK